MTALDQILIGIEKLPISGKKKNEYMLELMYADTDEHIKSRLWGVHSQSLGNAPDDLINAFLFNQTTKDCRYWYSLHEQLIKNNWK